MNILFIVAYAPTPIRTRPYNLLRTLARRGHTVTLATLWENEQERAALTELENKGICVIAAALTKPRSAWNCLRALPTSLPLQSVYCWQPELAARMRQALGSRQQADGRKQRARGTRQKAEGTRQGPFDIIHVEHLRGAKYGLALQPLTCNLKPVTPVVWDSVDCISHLFEQAVHNSRSKFGRLVTRFELPRTKNHEAWLVRQFDRVLVTSPIDAAALEALGSGSRFQESSRFQVSSFRFQVADRGQPIAPSEQPGTRNLNVVSRNPQSAMSNDQSPTSNVQRLVSHLQSPISILPNGVDLEFFSPCDAPREPATIVFTGKMNYHANVTAALHLVHDIMPLVWKKRPNVQVHIVGQDPPSQVRKLSAHDASPITVTGRVPDVRPYLQRATLAVAPMSYGAGIQNKVLEAMACATPVVATSPAISALQACPDEHLLVADEPASFARQIVRLLDDRDLQLRIGIAGRRYVEQHHDWDRIVERLEGIYHEVA